MFPMRRVGPKGSGQFERISWDAALDEIAARFKVIANGPHGPQAILPYSYCGTMGKIQSEGLDRRFFHRLGASLLDRTMVFLGSNLGDGSSHSVKNLPVLLAGGGFQHGQHLPFDPQSPPPLCNLYVSMLQRLGIETNKFGTSTGTLTGLDHRA